MAKPMYTMLPAMPQMASMSEFENIAYCWYQTSKTIFRPFRPSTSSRHRVTSMGYSKQNWSNLRPKGGMYVGDLAALTKHYKNFGVVARVEIPSETQHPDFRMDMLDYPCRVNMLRINQCWSVDNYHDCLQLINMGLSYHDVTYRAIVNCANESAQQLISNYQSEPEPTVESHIERHLAELVSAACSVQNREVVTHLVENLGAKIRFVPFFDEDDSRPGIEVAIRNNGLDFVEWVADLPQTTKLDITCMATTAAKNNRLEMFVRLANRGIDLRDRYLRHATPEADAPEADKVAAENMQLCLQELETIYYNYGLYLIHDSAYVAQQQVQAQPEPHSLRAEITSWFSSSANNTTKGYQPPYRKQNNTFGFKVWFSPDK